MELQTGTVDEGKSISKRVGGVKNRPDVDEKIVALLHFLNFPDADYDRFTKSDYNDNMYLIDAKITGGLDEFLVCTDEEAEQEYHNSFMGLMDDLGLESFTKEARDYILEHYANGDLIQEIYEESNYSYAEDIKLEEETEQCVVTLNEEFYFENELLAIAYEDGYLTQGDFCTDDALKSAIYDTDEVLEHYKDELADMDFDELIEFYEQTCHCVDEWDDAKENRKVLIENILSALEELSNESSFKTVKIEVDINITNRLFRECLEYEIIQGSDLKLNVNIDGDGNYIGDDDLVSMYCEYAKDPKRFGGYRNAVEWFIRNIGMKEFEEFCKNHPETIDWDAVMEYTKELDGRGHELNSWDGVEYEETVNDTIYYIYPDCDFRALEAKGEISNEEMEER